MSEERVYKLSHNITGNLRQLRGTLPTIRELWAREEEPFALWQDCPGHSSHHLSIEQFALCFLLRKHEKRYRKTK